MSKKVRNVRMQNQSMAIRDKHLSWQINLDAQIIAGMKLTFSFCGRTGEKTEDDGFSLVCKKKT